MGIVDNIVTAIVLVIIIVPIGGFIIHSHAKGDIERLEQKQLFFSYNNYENDVNSFLLITDDESDKAMGTLASYALYKRSDIVTIGGIDIDVPAKIELALDRMFGPGNYYLNITPRLYDVNLNFVIDGSGSLTAEREVIRLNLKDMVEKAKEGGREVKTNIFIISDSVTDCTSFDMTIADPADPIVDAHCTVIDDKSPGRNMYPTSEPSGDYRRMYDIYPPYNAPGKPDTERSPEFYYEPDWAAGVSFAIGSAITDATSRIILVFPVAGEISTGSAADECYITDFANEYARLFCEFCHDSCDPSNPVPTTATEIRSWDIVNKVVSLAIDQNVIINPIFAYQCNYYSQSTDPANNALWTQWNIKYNSMKTPTPPIDTASGAFCSDSTCTGCTGPRSAICYHPECVDDLRAQMEFMRSETNGVISEITSPADIPVKVGAAVEQNLEPYTIIIGVKKDAPEQFVYEKKVPLPVGNDFINVRLHLYR